MRTSITSVRGSLLLFGVLAAAVAISRCESVPLTAPAGSTMFLQANPNSVPANGGRSLVSAMVIEPSGQLVPDGTQVFFLTDLGSIDSSAKTVDGIARVYFVSDARSGTGTVTAMSGGDVTTSTTQTTSATTLATTSFRGSARGAGPLVGSGSSAAAAAAQATVTITVGAALPDKIVVAARPQLITDRRESTIVATVYDGNGNPVQNVPVIFKIDSVTVGGIAVPLLERLASGSAPRYTDSTGQAFDRLFTSAVASVDARIVTISATTSNNKTASVEVAIY